MQIMHYLILISLSTDRESSILRVVLLSYKQTDTTKGFKEDKEEHETITRLVIRPLQN